MKKKTIITVIVILFLCAITWLLFDSFSGRSSNQAGDDSRKATANGQAEDLDIDSEEKKESGASDEHAGNSSLEKPEERSTEDSSTDTKMDMGTEQPSENLDNEVTIPDDWEE